MGRFINDTTGVLVSVDDSKDDRFAAGWTREGSKPAAKPAAVQSATPDDTWTVAKLKGFATDNGIELGKASNKADILTAIAAGASHGSSDSADDQSGQSES